MDKKQSSEDYLERILMLQKENPNKAIRAIDIANSFSYSRPSVSIALKKLLDLEYVYYDDNQGIHLTEKGLMIASQTFEKHEIIGGLLIDIGVSSDTAYEDACKVEHYISDETFEALKTLFYKKHNQ